MNRQELALLSEVELNSLLQETFRKVTSGKEDTFLNLDRESAIDFIVEVNRALDGASFSDSERE